MVVTTGLTNWCRYKNRKTILFFSSAGISSIYFLNILVVKPLTHKHIYCSHLHRLCTLRACVCFVFFWSSEIRRIFHTHSEVAAFFILSMNWARATLRTPNSVKYYYYAQITFCQYFSSSSLSSSFNTSYSRSWKSKFNMCRTWKSLNFIRNSSLLSRAYARPLRILAQHEDCQRWETPMGKIHIFVNSFHLIRVFALFWLFFFVKW